MTRNRIPGLPHCAGTAIRLRRQTVNWKKDEDYAVMCVNKRRI